MDSEQIKKRLTRNDFGLLFLFLLIVIGGYIISSQKETTNQVEVEQQEVAVTVNCPHHTGDTLSLQNLEKLLIKTHMEHPKIVMAQIRLESGNLDSKLTRENNNFLGMKYPSQRPTTSIGEKNGFANFRTWQDCVYDYLIWQSRYAKKLSEDEYYNHLSNVYAEDSSYIAKLKQIANE